ncbi:MAG: M23 family metallopeptidase [Verrucomicrobiaceae bacterium]|nr:M23 family metallopeptidase [Verrucomicrobiaceae bacterium]
MPSALTGLALALQVMACLAINAQAQIKRLDLVLPTDNRALLEGRPEDFYQFIDRTVDGVQTTPWEGGQFGYVRDPKKLRTGETLYARFHEGLDIKPMRRDAAGEPLDEVRSIAPGEVVHAATESGRSNYGRYVVVRHDWGYGPFCSLYAHLREVRVGVGMKVAAGGVIGIMGYTGTGIDRRRAHTHVELNLFLSSRFEAWHDGQFKTPNFNGVYNGMNLVGLDLSRLFLALQKNPATSAAEFVTQTEAFYRVAVPGGAPMELLKNYPWLCHEAVPATPPSWEITFSGWGLPVNVKPGTRKTVQPVLLWVKPSTMPYYYQSHGCVAGSGDKPVLTEEGAAHARLVSGDFPDRVDPQPPSKEPAVRLREAGAARR